jgi:hypothetical protein
MSFSCYVNMKNMIIYLKPTHSRVEQSEGIYSIIKKLGRTPHKSSQFVIIKICNRVFTHFYINATEYKRFKSDKQPKILATNKQNSSLVLGILRLKQCMCICKRRLCS